MQIFERDFSAYPFDYQTIETMDLRHCNFPSTKGKKPGNQPEGEHVTLKEISQSSDNLSCHRVGETGAKAMMVGEIGEA